MCLGATQYVFYFVNKKSQKVQGDIEVAGSAIGSSLNLWLRAPFSSQELTAAPSFWVQPRLAARKPPVLTSQTTPPAALRVEKPGEFWSSPQVVESLAVLPAVIKLVGSFLSQVTQLGQT